MENPLNPFFNKTVFQKSHYLADEGLLCVLRLRSLASGAGWFVLIQIKSEALARVRDDDEPPFVYCVPLLWWWSSPKFFHCELSLSLNASSTYTSKSVLRGRGEVVAMLEMTLCLVAM